MKRNIALVAAVFLVGLYATEAKAQSITIKTVDISTAKQVTITAEAKLPGGWKLNSVSMEARPPKGAAGPGGRARAGNTGGNIYAATITGLTSGKDYEVQAIMDASDDQGTTHIIFSAAQTVTVK